LLVFFDISCFPFELLLVPDYLWVKYGDFNSVEVSTKDCINIGRFIDAIKMKMPNSLDKYDPNQIDLFYKNSNSNQNVKLDSKLELSRLVALPGFEKDSDLIIEVRQSVDPVALACTLVFAMICDFSYLR